MSVHNKGKCSILAKNLKLEHIGQTLVYDTNVRNWEKITKIEHHPGNVVKITTEQDVHQFYGGDMISILVKKEGD